MHDDAYAYTDCFSTNKDKHKQNISTFNCDEHGFLQY